MDVTEYRIIGLDAERLPLIQTRPCIDLIFELNEAAPTAWCEEFQSCVGKQPFSIKVDAEIGLHIETWVRKPEQIEQSLATVNELVAHANQAYKLRLKSEGKVVVTDDRDKVVSPEQQFLNSVVAGLVFEAR